MSLQIRVRRLDTTIHTPPTEHLAIGNPLVPHLNALKAALRAVRFYPQLGRHSGTRLLSRARNP